MIVATDRALRSAGTAAPLSFPVAREVVLVVALTQRGRVLLTERACGALDGAVIGLPGGAVGDPGAAGESPEEAACRHLRGETGYGANELVFLTRGPSSSGEAPEMATFFLAPGLRALSAPAPEHRVPARVHAIPAAKVRSWLQRRSASGRFVDPRIWAGLHLAGDLVPRWRLPD